MSSERHTLHRLETLRTRAQADAYGLKAAAYSLLIEYVRHGKHGQQEVSSAASYAEYPLLLVEGARRDIAGKQVKP